MSILEKSNLGGNGMSTQPESTELEKVLLDYARAQFRRFESVIEGGIEKSKPEIMRLVIDALEHVVFQIEVVRKKPNKKRKSRSKKKIRTVEETVKSKETVKPFKETVNERVIEPAPAPRRTAPITVTGTTEDSWVRIPRRSFTKEEVLLIHETAKKRHQTGHISKDYIGCFAEFAACKALGVPWEYRSGNSPDIGSRTQVRGAIKSDSNLILRGRDKDSDNFILVTTDKMDALNINALNIMDDVETGYDFIVKGWISGLEGRQIGKERTMGEDKVILVSASQLHSIAGIPVPL